MYRHQGAIDGIFDDWQVSILADIQARVGELLGAKAKLLEMSKSPMLTISTEAQSLLTVQSELETEFQQVLPIIDKVNSGVYEISDFIQPAAFYWKMDTHLSNVKDLEQRYIAGGESAKAPSFLGGSMLWIAGIGIGVYLLFKKKGVEKSA